MTQTLGVAADVRLRELSDEEFVARYGCDRFTSTVLANRFRYVAGHMTAQLLTHAFSPIIRDTADLSGMLSGPASMHFPMAGVSETLPLFYGSIPDAVRLTLEEYGVERLVPGDTVMVNDYYRVGTHLNDVCNIRPVFFEGELVGAVTIRAHMMDMGGRAMGGFESTKANVYEDGLRLPPILLYSAGEPVRSTFKLLFDNTRFASLIVPDLQTVYHSLELGERLVVETIRKYGMAAYTGAIRYACDAAEEAMGDALEAIPDGVYEGEEWLDSDGLPDSPEYVVQLKVIKAGRRAEFDFRGSAPATRTAVNCSWADVKTAVAIALKFLIDPRNPVTSGTLRNVDVVVPPDSLINPSPPHACQFYWEPVQAMIFATFKALNPVVGAGAWASSDWGGLLHRAEGTGPDGPWASPTGNPGTGGAWGATRHGDGEASNQMIFLNMLHSGIEAAERESPYAVIRSEYVPDTAGPGTFRGGPASVSDLLWRWQGWHRVQQFHVRRPPGGGGVNGGGAGALGAVWAWDGADTEVGRAGEYYLPVAVNHPVYREARAYTGVYDPRTNEADPHGDYLLVPEEVPTADRTLFRTLTTAGGGWGDPLERDPAKVRIDVRDEYVTIEGAARDYGVVVVGDPANDPEALTVDLDATAQLRAEMRAAASPG